MSLILDRKMARRVGFPRGAAFPLAVRLEMLRAGNELAVRDRGRDIRITRQIILFVEPDRHARRRQRWRPVEQFSNRIPDAHRFPFSSVERE